MTIEERVECLENKLTELIEIVKYIVCVDDSIKANHANLILEQLDNLREGL